MHRSRLLVSTLRSWMVNCPSLFTSMDWKRFQIAFSRRALTGGRSCCRNSFRSICPFCVVSNCWNSALISSSFLMSNFSNWMVARNSSKVMRPEWSCQARARERKWTNWRRVFVEKSYLGQSRRRFRSDPTVWSYFAKDVLETIPSERKEVDRWIDLSVFSAVNDLFFSLLVDVSKHIAEKYSFARLFY